MKVLPILEHIRRKLFNGTKLNLLWVSPINTYTVSDALLSYVKGCLTSVYALGCLALGMIQKSEVIPVTFNL